MSCVKHAWNLYRDQLGREAEHHVNKNHNSISADAYIFYKPKVT
jgi:uncharacterized protein (DUF2225 family)